MSVLLPNAITQDDDMSNLVLPEGWYNIEIYKSDQYTSQSNVTMLRVFIRILSGKFKDYTKILYFSIYDGTEKQIRFNRNLLFKIAQSCGVTHLANTNQIENKPFRVKFGVREYDDHQGNKREQNQMLSFEPANVSDDKPEPLQDKRDGEVKIEPEQVKQKPPSNDPAPQPAAKTQVEIDDDEIPF